MKRQNKLGSYLAVTAGVGCAASVAEGAIQVVDLSGVATTGFIPLPAETGDATIDLFISSDAIYGYLNSVTNTSFFDDREVRDYPGVAQGYTAGPATFPFDSDTFASWVDSGGTLGFFRLVLTTSLSKIALIISGG